MRPRSAVLALTVVVFALTGAMAEAAQRRAGSAGRSPQNGAQDGALVDLHELRREGGRLCMAEHSHVGTSGEQPSRKAAEVAAQRDWTGFTAWEYGDQWGSPVLAAITRGRREFAKRFNWSLFAFYSARGGLVIEIRYWIKAALALPIDEPGTPFSPRRLDVEAASYHNEWTTHALFAACHLGFGALLLP